ncbi:MAG: rhamnogalacturonan lyase [Bacteroidaceae bacterium]|nr:rhamnogalacturonan lyase [Bacteroidaceae bacterium]
MSTRIQHQLFTFSILLSLVCTPVSAQPAYDLSRIQNEDLGRGLVCVRDGDSVVISWRLLNEDKANTAFNVYCNNKKLNKKPLTQSTFIKAKAKKQTATYRVTTLDDGKESGRKDGTFTLNAAAPNSYISIPLKRPADGVTPNGQRYRYTANDASVGDVDGDGEYEIILKWDPSNSHDNSHEGYTGNVYLDCYRLTGEHLWRIDLGKNIRAGAHYTQFIVYDLDGDGKAEMVCKTADGTRDGQGIVIGDSAIDHRIDGVMDKQIDGKERSTNQHISGRILQGPEYLTVFSGLTGKALYTTDYIPPRGDVRSWGDSYGNRCDRFLACVGYLDGIHPSVIMCRGYYTKTYLAAFDWDGQRLTLRWLFDSEAIDKRLRAENPQALPYSGQGNHNLRVADVDGDGCDEITYGSMAVDHDGTPLYTTGMGHGDAIHLMPFYPDSTQLQVWDVHENRHDGSDFRDARTGRIIFQIKSNDDVGRGMAADIDPTNPGLEMWSSTQRGYYDVTGQLHETSFWIPQNSAVWWDGDLCRELLDRGAISKYNWQQNRMDRIFQFEGCEFNNGSKSNPCLAADILGDWREEVIVRTRNSSELRIYHTTLPTDRRFPCWMHDIPYRLSVATENVGYNQPREPGCYFASDMKEENKP